MNSLIEHTRELFGRALAVMEKKNHDYSSEEDPLKNFRFSEYVGVATTEQAILVRMLDKVARLANMVNGKEMKVEEEKFEDTVLDLINYAAILAYAYKQGQEINPNEYIAMR